MSIWIRLLWGCRILTDLDLSFCLLSNQEGAFDKLGEEKAPPFRQTVQAVRTSLESSQRSVFFGLGSCDGGLYIAPSQAVVGSPASTQQIEHLLAYGKEVKKNKNEKSLHDPDPVMAADQLVINYAAIYLRDGAPNWDCYSFASRQPWSKHDCVQRIPVKSRICENGSIVERGGK
jgi:hypothetical protein